MGRRPGTQRLSALMNGKEVGTLTRMPSGAISFRYSTAWLDDENAMPISLSLPLGESSYTGKEVGNYFDNLLPDDAAVRQRIAERVGANGASPFDLLNEIGRDCVGALQLIPDGVAVLDSRAMTAENISDEEIARRLRDLKSNPLGVGIAGDFRLSIAGSQEKTALLEIDGAWYKPQGPTPTSHILKPAIGKLANGIDLSRSVENEWLCLKLARAFGLEAASARMAEFDGIRTLIVERFDRRWSADGSILYRLPQEDMCQSLGKPSSQKYEVEGGPGIRDIMDLLMASNDAAGDRDTFMRMQIVFFLLMAIDGHAKNFSIFLSPSGFRLTPLYDVMTVLPALAARQIERKDVKMAMSVGKNRHRRIQEIFRRHWLQTARICRFDTERTETILHEILDRAQTAVDQVQAALPESVPDEIAEPTLEGVLNLTKRLSSASPPYDATIEFSRT